MLWPFFVVVEVMVPTSSPKLEDFLGGATMGAQDYGTHEREAMALSLDSIYYSNQNAEPETNRDHSSSLDLLSYTGTLQHVHKTQLVFILHHSPSIIIFNQHLTSILINLLPCPTK